jgi:hypothetical protein
LPDLVWDEAGQPAWTWLTNALRRAPRNAVMIKTYDEQGGRVLSSVWLDSAAVVLQTN